MPRSSLNISQTKKVSKLLISLHHAKESVLVVSPFYVKNNEYSEDIFFIISDKPNVSTVSFLEKFAFVHDKIVNNNQIVDKQ